MPAQLLGLVPEPDDVRIVVLDVGGDDDEGVSGQVDDGLALAGRFAETHPHVGVVLVHSQPDSIGLAVLRAGARDVVPQDASVEDWRWALRRALDAVQTVAPTHQVEATGRVVTVASPKGGVGKTTLATNLAIGLAAQSPTGTVLVDLDVQFGDVAAALDLEPDYTLGDVVASPASRDSLGLKSLLARHPSGLQVLCGVRSPADADAISADQLSTVIGHLKSEFRYVVIDTAPGLHEQTLAALDHTTDLVLITSLDVPGIRGLRKEMEMLDELDLPPTTRSIIVNFADKDGGLSVADVEASIGRKVDVVLPRSKKFTLSTNQGSPLLESQPRDRISKEMGRLVMRFAPLSVNDSGWSGRHRGNRA
nr:AAA family ATPase [Ornithinimicrobium sediminis]